MTTRVVLDCDTGTDDAVAIMAAVGHPRLELVAVTTVNGNVALEHTTQNTLRALDHVGADVPVYAGASKPLVRKDFPIPRQVLNAGNPDFQLELLDLPPARSRPRDQSAVAFLVDFFMDPANRDVVLVATGPLTNVAAALIAEPQLADRIGRLVLMGGAYAGGNVTPVAEFNLWVDPEAARVVFAAGLEEVVVVPLDATHSVPLKPVDCERLDRIGTPAATASAALIRHRIAQDNDIGDEHAAPVHDPLAVAYVVDPGVITRSGRFPVTVETTGELTVGQLIVDSRPFTTEPSNATVALEASGEAYRQFLIEGCGG